MPKQPIASLTASLMNPPATAVDAVPDTAASGAGKPAPPRAAAAASGRAGKPVRPVAQTVKLEHPLFVRLKNHSANRRMSHQAIFVDALEEYLERHGG